MSQVVEGQVDSITETRRAMFAGNTVDTMRPMDVAEAAYYQQHPEELPGAEAQVAAAVPDAQPEEAAAPAADAQLEQPAPQDDDETEVTPENANLISMFVTRKEFNRLLNRLNALEFKYDELEERVTRFNKTAPHKI